MITRGAFADLSICAAVLICTGLATVVGGGGITCRILSSCLPLDATAVVGSMIISVGRSTNVGPGRPYHAIRYALRIAVMMVGGSLAVGRVANFVCGVNKATASSSWNPPFVTLLDDVEPPRTRRGNALVEALPICSTHILSVFILNTFPIKKWQVRKNMGSRSWSHACCDIGDLLQPCHEVFLARRLKYKRPASP